MPVNGNEFVRGIIQLSPHILFWSGFMDFELVRITCVGPCRQITRPQFSED